MENANITSAVKRCRETISEFADLIARHETNTRYTLIDPILWALGWETWNPRQCELEYRPEGQIRVDYALFNRQGTQVIAIEAKRLGHIGPQSSAQLAKYTDQLPEGIAVLTDGDQWIIYNLAKPGAELHQRLDSQLRITQHDSSHVATRFRKTLQRNLWW